MYRLQHWKIDWDKVKNQEDIILILKNMNLRFEDPCTELRKISIMVKKENDNICD
jgi:hypothetical protein